MAGLIIFVEDLGKKTALELRPDATVADLAAAAECSPEQLRFQGGSFPDASQPLADVGVCQQSEVSITPHHERWKPKDKKIMREAVEKLAVGGRWQRCVVSGRWQSSWQTTREIEKWMTKNHNGRVAPNVFGIEDWDVSSVTDMSFMFDTYGTRDVGTFNSDISRWDVSSVTSMFRMFIDASSFNCDISRWDVSSVRDMSFMFHGASSFNHDISGWNVSSVREMIAFDRGCPLPREHLPGRG